MTFASGHLQEGLDQGRAYSLALLSDRDVEFVEEEHRVAIRPHLPIPPRPCHHRAFITSHEGDSGRIREEAVMSDVLHTLELGNSRSPELMVFGTTATISTGTSTLSDRAKCPVEYVYIGVVGERESVELVPVRPPDLVVLFGRQVGRLPRPLVDEEDVQLERVIGESQPGRRSRLVGGYPELLLELPAQGLDEGLAGLYSSTGEIPHVGIVISVGASMAEEHLSSSAQQSGHHLNGRWQGHRRASIDSCARSPDDGDVAATSDSAWRSPLQLFEMVFIMVFPLLVVVALLWLNRPVGITQSRVIESTVTSSDVGLVGNVQWTDDGGIRHNRRVELTPEHVTSGTVPLVVDASGDLMVVDPAEYGRVPLTGMAIAAGIGLAFAFVVVATMRGLGFVRGTGQPGEMTSDQVQESRAFYWRH